MTSPALAILAAFLGTPVALDSPPSDSLVVVRREAQRVQLIQRISPAVACLFAGEDRASGGSGVIIDADGYGLTNFHVVAAMLADRAGEAGLPNGNIYPIEVLGTDPGGDLAMFRIIAARVERASRPVGFVHVPLGDSHDLAVGQPVLALGNPFGLSDDYTPSVSLGIVSGLHRYQPGVKKALLYSDCIQTDAAINPGNSGGPLFDLAGRLVGINGRVAIEERGRVNVGVGFAIPIDQVKRFIPALRAGLHVARADAGFTVADDSGRVLVSRILDDSAAKAAGLRLDDEILRFAGEKIPTKNRFVAVIGSLPGGWPIDVEYQRDGRRHKVRFNLDNLKLPTFSQGPPGRGPQLDPYAPHPVTTAAQRRAVKRLLGRYRNRTAARPDEDTHGKLAVGLEPAIHARLLAAPLADFKPVAATEVRGRIALVLRADLNDTHGKLAVGLQFDAAFDDQTGDLLSIAFQDPATGRDIRYEYGDAATGDATRRARAETPSPPAQDTHGKLAVGRIAANAARAVVKIYGPAAGREHDYGTGTLISADGKILTTLSIRVTAGAPRVFLPDGRQRRAKVLRTDKTRQLALLQIKARDLPFLSPASSSHLRQADSVVALGNWFGIAHGREHPSVNRGSLALRTSLDARRLAQEFEYGGPVLVIDTITANPGAAGGPLLDTSGNFVGLIGEVIESAESRTRLNYAIPGEQLIAFLENPDDKPAESPLDEPAADPPPASADLGIKLARLGFRKVPAFVDRVRPGSPAARADVRADDLILAFNGRRIDDADAYEREARAARANTTITLTLKRGQQILSVELSLEAAP